MTDSPDMTRPYCQAQVGAWECGVPVLLWGHQCLTHDPKGKTRPVRVVTNELGRVQRYKVDQVGNDLSTTLMWCNTHHEPVWIYGDGSYQCPYDTIVEVRSDDHEIVAPPWENR